MLRQTLEVPNSLTALHLSLSDLSIEGWSAKYTEFKGCYRLFMRSWRHKSEPFADTFNTLPQDNSSLNRNDYILT